MGFASLLNDAPDILEVVATGPVPSRVDDPPWAPTIIGRKVALRPN